MRKNSSSIKNSSIRKKKSKAIEDDITSLYGCFIFMGLFTDISKSTLMLRKTRMKMIGSKKNKFGNSDRFSRANLNFVVWFKH